MAHMLSAISLFLLISWQMLDISVQDREVLIRDKLVLLLCDQIDEYNRTGNLPPAVKMMPGKYNAVKPGDKTASMDGFRVNISSDKKNKRQTKTSSGYDGHYDIKAVEAIFLCSIMDEYLKTGKEPKLSQDRKDNPSFGNYLTWLEKVKCWKFAWIPCDPTTYAHTVQKPCGWYEMKFTESNEECKPPKKS